MTPIDLRSDTVTRPSSAMRRAMVEAEVGDDVLDRDPTTQRLEARVAELLGMDDALFFPSGTQANQTGIALLTRPGTELLVESDAHLVHYELAGVAANWGVQIRPIATPDGLLTGAVLRGALRPASPHVPRAGAAAVENTHNAAGGKVMTPEVMAGIVAAAGAAGLPLHLDGALAAAALWALDHNLARLQDDHLHARLLADLLADCAALRPVPPESNIVMVDLVRERDTAEAVASKLAQAGLLVVPFGARRLRAVTHLDVGREDIERAAQIVARALA